METAPHQLEFPIQRDAVISYLYWQALIQAAVLVPVFGLGIVLGLVWHFWLGRWLPQRQAAAMRYWLDGPTLRVDGGVYFLHRKAIPLDRITDLVLVQGPLMRMFGIWGLRVQTAGTGHGVARSNVNRVVQSGEGARRAAASPCVFGEPQVGGVIAKRSVALPLALAHSGRHDGSRSRRLSGPV
jgi:putative membrane protein